MLATQTAILDAGADDGDSGQVGVKAELAEHAGLHDGVLIEGDQPIATQLLSLAEELIEGSGDAEVLCVLDQRGIAGEGTDVGDVGRAVIDEDECIGLGTGSFEVLAQSLEVGLVGDDADGAVHILSGDLFGEEGLDGLNNAGLVNFIFEDEGVSCKQGDAAQEAKQARVGDIKDEATHQQIGKGPEH